MTPFLYQRDMIPLNNKRRVKPKLLPPQLCPTGRATEQP
jgi:hypothetical protein